MTHHVVARTAAGALAIVLGGSGTLLGPPAHAATSGREVRLTFDGSSLRENAGTGSMAVGVATHNGGRIADTSGADGSSAAGFPSYRAESPRLAVVTVVDDSGADDLSPEDADFRFGTDFRLNSLSEGSTADNGNNLIQRGLAGADMQYKLQVDHNRPSCRIKGSSGALTVGSSHVVASDVWYRTTCTRRGNEVELRVIRLSDQATWVDRKSGPIGTLKARSRSVPVSVGGKVTTDGAVKDWNSDQFNGRMDNAFINIF